MFSSLALYEIVQEVGSATPPPLSLRVMGKSLVSISFFALVTFGVTAKAAWHAFRGKVADQPGRTRSTIDAILFWGLFTLSISFFHTVMGLLLTALSVRAGGPIVPEAHWLIATGIAVPLAASAYGLFVFLLAALAWFGFRHWYARSSHQPV